MNEQELKSRTRQFALRIIRLVKSMPKGLVERCIGAQLIRSGTSVGANYRSVCRARSKKEFISKLSIVEEEADESAYWIELLVDEKVVAPPLLSPLLEEANALARIMRASRLTALKSLKPRAQDSSQSETETTLNPSFQSKIENRKSKIP